MSLPLSQPSEAVIARLSAELPWLTSVALTFSPTHRGLCNTSHLALTEGCPRYVLREGGGDDPVLGISREAEARAYRALSESTLGPSLLAFLLPEGHVLAEFVPNNPPEPEWWNTEEAAPAIAASLRRFHALPGNGKPFSPVADIDHRIVWVTEQSAAQNPRNPVVVEALAALALHQQQAREVAAVQAASSHTAPGLCHGDFFSNNMLRTESGLRVIDVEFSGEGDGVYDLACISYSLNDEAIRPLLTAYFGECSEAHLQALHRHRYIAAVWDAAWALVQLVRDRPGHDYAGHVRETIALLPDFYSRALQ